MKSRAIFLDRDGTVSFEVGYINHVSRLQVMPQSVEAIRCINQAGFRAVVVTNQSGVARGYFEEPLLEKVHDSLRRQLAAGNARVDGIYYCPHHPREGKPPFRQDCTCRKPSIGMLEKAARDLDIQLSGSYMVGDTLVDMRTARNAGLCSVLVLTGYGRGEFEHHAHQWPFQPDHIAEDLRAAVGWIFSREGINPR
ncbi:MAG: D-glycero-beta-D-manno-heptose 1,7-bisphosphate 7-phosphatase [Acidobacteriota bacterium]